MAADDVVGSVRAVVERMRANPDEVDEQVLGCRTIVRLAQSPSDKRVIGSVDGVCEAILAAMRQHEGVALLQEQACRAISTLAMDDANRTAVGSVVGVFNVIVGAMRRHKGVAVVQEYGCVALGNLACNSDDNRCAIGTVAGVFDVIVGAMRRHKGVAEVQEYGCLALGNLVCKHDVNRSAIGSVAGVFDVIVGAMRRHKGVAEVQQNGCLALGNLAWNCGEACMDVRCLTVVTGVGITMWRSWVRGWLEWCTSDVNRSAIESAVGVVDVIVGAMRRHRAVAEVQKCGSLVLGNLAWNRDSHRRPFAFPGPRRVVEVQKCGKFDLSTHKRTLRYDVGAADGVFDVIVASMRRHEGVAVAQEYGCWALATAARTNGRAACHAIGRMAGLFDVIVGAMRRHEGVAEVQECGSLALANLAITNHHAIGSVAGGFEAIVGGMRRHEGVASVQEYGCFAFGNLACNNDDNRHAIGGVAGVFEAIVGALRRHEGEADVQAYACLALMQLACNNDANRSAIGSVAGVFEAIVGGMRRHEGEAKVQRWACLALCQLVTCSVGGFFSGWFGWLQSSTEASAEVATAERNATLLTGVAGVKELLQASRLDDAARVLEAIMRAEVSQRRAAAAERRTADAERRAREASKLAEDEAKRANDATKRADDEAKRANEEAKRADIAERRAATLAAPPGPTPATARLAMVIANAKYQGGEPPLPRCTTDGEAMAATLRQRGFDVTQHVNVDSDALDAAVGEFGRLVRSRPGCIAVWYFTGHGFEAGDGVLNLVPVDGARRLRGHPLTLRRLEQRLHEYTAGQESTIIIILDCCRTNDNNETYKGRHGPRWTHASKGDGTLRNDQYLSQYLVAHACESGRAARADAEGIALSPFTHALVPPLRKGVPLQVALTRATDDVVTLTNNTQRPCYRSCLTVTPLVL